MKHFEVGATKAADDADRQVSREDVLAGQAAYTPGLLAAYDLMVHRLICPFVWRCPTRLVASHYQRHASANHLDVGVGTGFFLDYCRFPAASPRIALLDLNQHTLDYTAARIARYQPRLYRADVLERLELNEPKFASVAINYLLHCLPGTLRTKAAALDHLLEWMQPDGVMFGATVLYGGVPRNRMATWLMDLYNTRKIFCNRQDHLDDLYLVLRQRFEDVSVDVRGCVAMFACRGLAGGQQG